MGRAGPSTPGDASGPGVIARRDDAVRNRADRNWADRNWADRITGHRWAGRPWDICSVSGHRPSP